MPSPIAHSSTSYFIHKLLPDQHRLFPKIKYRWSALIYCLWIGNLADLDFLPQVLMNIKSHRGPSHSICAALLISLVFTIVYYALKKSKARYFFLLTFGLYCLHLFLDFWTAGGAGMQLFWPVSTNYHLSPFPIFPRVRHSEGLFFQGHIIFILFESCYSLCLLILLPILHSFQKRRTYSQ